MVTVSEFPHGYSLGQGRLLYYYGKSIFYKIPPTYPVSSLTFNQVIIQNTLTFTSISSSLNLYIS